MERKIYSNFEIFFLFDLLENNLFIFWNYVVGDVIKKNNNIEE